MSGGSVLGEVHALVQAECDPSVVSEAVEGLYDDVVSGNVEVGEEEPVLRRQTAKALEALRLKDVAVATLAQEKVKKETDAEVDITVAEGGVKAATEAADRAKAGWLQFAHALTKGSVGSSGSKGDVEHSSKGALPVQLEIQMSQSPGGKKRRIVTMVGNSANSAKGTSQVQQEGAAGGIESRAAAFEIKLVGSLTKSDRDVGVRGRLISKSIGEKSKKDVPKMELCVKDQKGDEIEFFALGAAFSTAAARLVYDHVIVVAGGKVEIKDGVRRLVAFAGMNFELKAVSEPAESYPEDDFAIHSLESGQAANKDEVFNLVIYVIKVFCASLRRLGERDISVQEARVRDSAAKSTIIELCDTAVGKMYGNAFFLIKRASTYNGTMQIFGKGMIIPYPDDLYFALDGKVDDLLA